MNDGQPAVGDDSFDGEARSFVGDRIAEVVLDLADRQAGEGAHHLHVARTDPVIRVAAEGAEAAIDAPVAQPQRHIQMATDGERLGDRQRAGERDLGRIGDQLGQPPLENMKAVAFFLRFAKAWLVRDGQVGRDMREFAFAVFVVTTDERDLHSQMVAHRIEDAIDLRRMDQRVGQACCNIRIWTPERERAGSCASCRRAGPSGGLTHDRGVAPSFRVRTDRRPLRCDEVSRPARRFPRAVRG